MKRRAKTLASTFLSLAMLISSIAFIGIKEARADANVDLMQFLAVQVGKTETLKIKPRENKISSVSAKSSKTDVATVATTKSSLKITGNSVGRTVIKTTIKYKHGNKKMTHRFKTTVIVSEERGVNITLKSADSEKSSITNNAKEAAVREMVDVYVNGVKAADSDFSWRYLLRKKNSTKKSGFRNWRGLVYDGEMLPIGEILVKVTTKSFLYTTGKEYDSDPLTLSITDSGNKQKKYKITVKQSEGGTITPNVKKAKAGQKVTVSVKTKSGYKVKYIECVVHAKNPYSLHLDKINAKKYKFTMLGHKVTLKPVFKKK